MLQTISTVAVALFVLAVLLLTAGNESGGQRTLTLVLAAILVVAGLLRAGQALLQWRHQRAHRHP